MKEKIQKLKKIKICLIVTFFSFLIGCLFFIVSKGDNFEIRSIIILLGFLPFFIFLTFSILSYHSKTTKVKLILSILTIIKGFFSLFYYLVAFGISAVLEFKHPITNIKYYQDKVKGEWLLKAFPEEIPSYAQNIYFLFAPGFLQAGTEIVLYYIDNNLNIEEFQRRQEEKAIWTGSIKEHNDYVGLDAIFYNTPVSNNENDFIIYLMEGRCDNSGYCNHGDYLVVAINPKTNEVVYKGADW